MTRHGVSCVGYPPTIAIITWFLISIGNLSSFDGSNVEESNFKEDLKWHSNKDEVYFIFTVGWRIGGRIILCIWTLCIFSQPKIVEPYDTEYNVFLDNLYKK